MKQSREELFPSSSNCLIEVPRLLKFNLECGDENLKLDPVSVNVENGVIIISQDEEKSINYKSKWDNEPLEHCLKKENLGPQQISGRPLCLEHLF